MYKIKPRKKWWFGKDGARWKDDFEICYLEMSSFIIWGNYKKILAASLLIISCIGTLFLVETIALKAVLFLFFFISLISFLELSFRNGFIVNNPLEKGSAGYYSEKSIMGRIEQSFSPYGMPSITPFFNMIVIVTENHIIISSAKHNQDEDVLYMRILDICNITDVEINEGKFLSKIKTGDGTFIYRTPAGEKSLPKQIEVVKERGKEKQMDKMAEVI